MAVNYSGARVEAVLPNVTPQAGEGPHWEEDTHSLVFVESLAGKLHRWNSVTGKHETIKKDGPTGFIIPRAKGSYVVGLGRQIVALDWDTQEVTKLAEVEKKGTGNRLNDGKCDPAGRLWTGSMGAEPEPAMVEPGMGVLGCLDTQGVWREHLENIDISNGLAWTRDARTMFYIDSIPRKVYGFDFDNENGTISNQRVVVDLSQYPVEAMGFPDGCCADTNDDLWVACFAAGRVVHFDTKTGAKLGQVALPTRNITSCCFGGPTYEDLYVTCARRGVTDEQFRTTQPLAGSLFKVTGLGVKGLPAPVYRG